MPQLNALQLVNAGLQELGLPSVVTIASAPDDQTGWQSLGLINSLGNQLIAVHDWQDLEGIVEIECDGVSTTFPLPDDYGRMVNQTHWASKNKRPMYGPMSPQAWSWVQYGIVSVGVYYRYRIIGDQFNVFPTPAAGEKFHFYYIKKDWVQVPSATPPTTADTVVNDTDIPIFDRYLMITGLKFKLWAAKGMNAQELGREFEYMLAARKSQTQGAPVISLDSRWDQLFISGQNVPDGSWNIG
jgi:hypothetical protein